MNASWEGRTKMYRHLKVAAIALLALVFIIPMASARPRVFFGSGFGPAYYGPSWYGPAWYGPSWYGYGYGPGWDAPGYGYRQRIPTTGSVKFETKLKNAAVSVSPRGGHSREVARRQTMGHSSGGTCVTLPAWPAGPRESSPCVGECVGRFPRMDR